MKKKKPTDPKIWTEEKKEEAIVNVLEKLSDGASLRSVLNTQADCSLPARSTFNKWLSESEPLQDRYAHACGDRQDLIFEEILEISDNAEQGETIEEDPEGNKIKTVKSDMLGHRKLKIDTRKWMLGKMNPEKYGDRIQQDVNLNKEQPLFPDIIE